MLRNTLQSLRQKVVTTPYPAVRTDPPQRFRGAPEVKTGRSFSDLAPAAVCPTNAITADEHKGTYTIDLARCIFCGMCADKSREGAIRMSRDFELANATKGAAKRIQRAMKGSLHLRHLDAGSCNACDWELNALLAPHYDLRRLGIDFVASPRHADAVMVTGSVTRNLEVAAQRTFAAMADPRLVIAVGACACSGGIAGTSYASKGGVNSILPVDVYIPGCPPRPEAILFGILLAIGRIEQKRKR